MFYPENNGFLTISDNGAMRNSVIKILSAYRRGMSF